MHISTLERSLLRSLLAGAVVLAGTSACSRPDRADAGSETNQPSVTAQPADTQATATGATADTVSAADNSPAVSQRTLAPDPGEDAAGYQPMSRDTAQDAAGETRASQTDTVTVGDSAQIGKPGERLEASQTSEQANQDTLLVQSDTARIRPPEDSSEISGAAVGSNEMARDTSVEVAQGDTAVQVEPETQGAAETDTTAVSVEVDTTTTAQAPTADTSATEVPVDTTTSAQAPAADTATIQVAVDTATADRQTEVAVETRTPVADTAVVVGDSTPVAKTGERLKPELATTEPGADTVAADTGRIRPPEVSSEVLGNVTTEEDEADPEEVESADAAVVAAAGVPSTGNAVTGANAVAQMSRQGQGCAVVTSSEDVRWDMSISPATLNPCGTGTMTLPKVVTGGAVGQ